MRSEPATTADLFTAQASVSANVALERVPLGEGAVLLRGAALAAARALVTAVDRIAARAPFRRMVTPGGFTMSVAMTNCGPVGWVSDRSGYRYDPVDPAAG